jgi:phosphomannomutase
MATFNPTIFRAYDVRGVVPDDFDAPFAQRLGDRVTSWMKAGTLVVGRDARRTSDELAYALIDGAVHAGARVIDVGVLSTPQFMWAIRSSGAVGGIMVTASHNPDRYNGFKIIANHGGIPDVIGGHAIRQVYDSHRGGHRAGGGIEYRDITADYASAVAYAAGFRGGAELRMSVDAPDAVLAALKRLGPIAPDHGLAVRFDRDGDRIVFYEDAAEMPADFIFLLLAEQLHLSPVVFDVRFSRTVKRRLAARNTPFTLSKVGRLHITEAMHASGAAFGGEISGHYYWKEMGGVECPELTLLRVYALVAASGRTLAELIAPYRVLHKSDELSFPVRDRKHATSVLRALSAHYKDGVQSEFDGLTIEYPEWWMNVRPSNTEPLLRLVVEADKKDLLAAEVSEISSLVKQSA